MSKEVAKKEATEVTTFTPHQGAEEILSKDVILPQIYLMQDTSDFVKEKMKDPTGKRLEAGNFIRSTDKMIVGSEEKPFEFIPLTYQNIWRIEEKSPGGRFEFRRYEPRTAKNEDLPWNYTENGTEWKRIKAMNLIALMPDQLDSFHKEIARAQAAGEIPDINLMVTPVSIQIRSTSFAKAGKAVATHFAKAKSMAQYGAKAHAFVMAMACTREKNEQGSFYVMQAHQTRKATKVEMEEAERWYQTVSTQAVKVHSDEEADGSSSADEEQF